MNLLKSYFQSNSLNMAKRYLEINGVESLSVNQPICPEDSRKPWAIWESAPKYGENCGLHCGSYRLKREAVADAKKFAEWLGIPYVNA